MATTKTRKKTLWENFLTFFGDIKIFQYPLFIVYDPGSYRIKGKDAREILGLLQPGDILLRGYDNYLDGKFIGGVFSHAGFYYGKAAIEDCPFPAGDPQRELFIPGEQMVVHSMAEGVFMEDILTFTRCDKLAILRLPEQISKQPVETIRVIDSFSAEEEAVYQRLKQGGSVDRVEAVAVAQKVALNYLGYDYDFGFDFETHKSFSCTEFVYFIYRCICSSVRLNLVEKSILFYKRKVLAPDDYLHTGLQQIYYKA